MNVIGFDVYWDEKFAAANNVKRAATLDEIYAASDYLSLHTNLTPETRDMISAKSFPKMKKGVLILNCARGEIVHTADMVEALKSGQVGGYGTDVLDEEPPRGRSPAAQAAECRLHAAHRLAHLRERRPPGHRRREEPHPRDARRKAPRPDQPRGAGQTRRLTTSRSNQ